MLWKIRVKLIAGVTLLISVIKWVPLVSTPAGFLSRNYNQCSPYEELQQHLACYLKKKEVITHIAVASIVTAAGTWWNMEEQRIYNRVGLQLERGTETWMSVERVLPGDDWGNYWKGMCCTCIHFTFEETSPTYLFIFTSVPVMPWFWLFFQGLSRQNSRWFWLNFLRIQHLPMCSKSHGKLTHCSKFWLCCLIHKVGEGFNKCLFTWVATLMVNLCFHWWENCRWDSYTSDTI